MIFLITMSYIILIILLLLFVHLLINLLSFQHLEAAIAATQEQGFPEPFVSLLVPARNEQEHVEMCVRSLLQQEYRKLEVLVLDDRSNDATASIVQHMLNTLPPEQQGRLKLVHGEPLPPDWVGKNFACHQLFQQAQGEYLFFTDADTVHAPKTVRAVVDCMSSLNVDLLTAQSEYNLKGFGERLLMPLLSFRVFTLLPLTLIRRRPEPIFATGNGPLLCFHRSAYIAAGGHQAIKGCILEDLALARAVKAAGYHIAFVDALNMISCHMYTSFAHTWQGFSRTFFAFYNYSFPAALTIILFDLLLFVFPPFMLFLSLFIHIPFIILFLSASSYGIAVLMRLLLAIRFTRSQKLLTGLLCVLHPFAILLGCVILFNSIRWHYRKQGTGWKGRYYAA